MPEALRGRFLGLAAPAVIAHLRGLGVTAVELLPVCHTAQDDHLARLGLPNYWGYSTLGFFAPDARFASGSRGEQVGEFQRMVEALHEAGIEVILDVVFNHTPEGGHAGATLSLRGIDNASYYRLQPDDPSRYLDYTGCGNTLATAHPQVRQLVLDSLRHLAALGVDGFRFDLATVLARDPVDFDRRQRLLRRAARGPAARRAASGSPSRGTWVRTATGWAASRPASPSGTRGFRDAARGFWRGDAGVLPELARRLTGSIGPLRLERARRHRQHQLRVLARRLHARRPRRVRAQAQRGERRGQPRRPARPLAQLGRRGPSRDARVLRARDRARRSLVATLALSQGVPMWLAGDEIGRTQRGNNNAYCHDDETSWLDWRARSRSARASSTSCSARCAVAARQRGVPPAPAPRTASRTGVGVLAAPRRRSRCSPPTGSDRRARAASALLLDAAAADPARRGAAGPGRAQRAAAAERRARTRGASALPDPGAGARWREVLDSACDTRHAPAARRSVRVAAHSLLLLEREAAP